MGLYQSEKAGEDKTLLYTSSQLTTAVGYNQAYANGLSISISGYKKIVLVVEEVAPDDSVTSINLSEQYELDSRFIRYDCGKALFAGIISEYSLFIFGFVMLTSNKTAINAVALRYSLIDKNSAGGYTGRKLELKVYGIK